MECISLLSSQQGITDLVASTTDIYFLTVLEAQSPRSGCQQKWRFLNNLCAFTQLRISQL